MSLPGNRSLISMIVESFVAGGDVYQGNFAQGEANFRSVLQHTAYKAMSEILSSEAQGMLSQDIAGPHAYLTGFDVHTTFRVCFVTSRGHLGLASEYALVGDLICVPQGSQTAFVLREEDDHFLNLGQCYISVGSRSISL